MSDRREFLKHSAQVAAAIAAANAWKVTGGAGQLLAASAAPAAPPLPDSTIKALMMDALNAAKSAGASYADVRVGRQQQNFVFTREAQINNVVDTDSVGCGVRALVDGAWGFSATRNLTTAGVTGAAKEAVAVAKANKMALDRPTVLAPAPVVPSAVWKSAYKTDPWDVSVEEKADLLLRANAIALKTPNVKYVFSGLFFVKAQRDYANSDGSITSQTTIRSWPLMQITAVAPDFSDFQNRGNVVPPMGRGWEYVLGADLVGNSAKWADEAAQKLKAKPVEPGKYDLVLHPSHLWLTIHESIGHPTELDRALGYEANYAGTSFVSPPEKVLGKLKYGPEFMNIQGDRSQEGGLSTIGFDDEGVKPNDFLIIKNGIFNDYQTTREQAEWISWWYKQNNMETRSHGCSYAQGWDNVQFQRMPNVSLLPGEKDLKFEDLVAATDNGIAIMGDGSFSIDQQRFNGQFGGQVAYEVKGGKLGVMLKDVAYQMRTPDFWNSMDMIGGKNSYELGGSFFDGKGQPGQVNAVSHGAVPSRFKQINVINTGRKV
jgi:TldD protein